MDKNNFSAEIGKFRFDNLLMNASGARCRTKEELDQLLESQAGAMVSKSATPNPRDGNPEPRYKEVSLGSINSMGLPNEGIDFYLKFAEENHSIKPIFISVAGMSLEENIQMIKKLNESTAHFLIELNLSCPNIPGKPQTAYDFERTIEVLDAVFAFNQKPLGVKLPPYFDIVHFQDMARILNQYSLAFVTCINSIGNGLIIDLETETTLIKPKDGFGGIGGDYVKPTALANVRMFRKLLRPEIAVIGCGGVKSGADVFEHILCGAEMVQVGTQLMRENTAVFPRLLDELKALMKEKGYETVNDFKGKLKEL